VCEADMPFTINQTGCIGQVSGTGVDLVGRVIPAVMTCSTSTATISDANSAVRAQLRLPVARATTPRQLPDQLPAVGTWVLATNESMSTWPASFTAPVGQRCPAVDAFRKRVAIAPSAQFGDGANDHAATRAGSLIVGAAPLSHIHPKHGRNLCMR
jgi:hypothetical protein